MPSKNTFEMKPALDLIQRYRHGLTIDPFANRSKLADITNDLDPQYDTDYHLDAERFLMGFPDASVDTVLYDPPFSSRQVSECYKKLGMTVNMETTQNSYWRKQKEQISRIVKPNGIVISFGWNSGGIGMKYGFDKLHIRLIAHGGNHNDTIITVERKRAAGNDRTGIEAKRTSKLVPFVYPDRHRSTFKMYSPCSLMWYMGIALASRIVS